MKLVGSRTSPYVRKIRVILAEKKLAFDFVEESAWNADTTVPRYNPLNKVPALVTDAGESIYDSAVIAEYLDAISGGGLIPSAPGERARVRSNEALGDGIADAAVAWVLLGREPQVSEAACGRQMAAVMAGIDALERVKFAKDPTIGEISVACALGYVDFRMPDLDWKASRPNLAGWYAKFCDYPSMKATVPAAP